LSRAAKPSVPVGGSGDRKLICDQWRS